MILDRTLSYSVLAEPWNLSADKNIKNQGNN